MTCSEIIFVGYVHDTIYVQLNRIIKYEKREGEAYQFF